MELEKDTCGSEMMPVKMSGMIRLPFPEQRRVKDAVAEVLEEYVEDYVADSTGELYVLSYEAVNGELEVEFTLEKEQFNNE